VKRHKWDRLLWGVRFTGGDGASFLIGSSWHKANNAANAGYPGEPTRALLFRTRVQARTFCAEQIKSARLTGGVCEKWRYAPVRIRETVREQVNGPE
jgi:hypothetical protein